MASPTLNPCWSRTGVAGDGSCPDLALHVHCRNCPAFSTAGRKLLDCQAPAGYLSDWTGFLAREKEEHAEGKASAVIFRLGAEWLALRTKRFKEISPIRAIHRLPHRNSSVLLGMVNVRGEIMLCVSLKSVLGIEDETGGALESSRVYKRMAVVEKERDQWVVPVDEIHGIQRFEDSALGKVPVTVAKSAVKFTCGMLSWQEKSVGLLDDELLFYSLKRSALA